LLSSTKKRLTRFFCGGGGFNFPTLQSECFNLLAQFLCTMRSEVSHPQKVIKTQFN